MTEEMPFNADSGLATSHAEICQGQAKVSGAKWSLATMLLWMIVPIACMVVAHLWSGSLYRRSPTAVQLFSHGLLLTLASYGLLYWPLYWLFITTPDRWYARIGILFVVSLVVMVIFMAPTYFASVWVAVVFIAVIGRKTRRWMPIESRQFAATMSSACLLLSVVVYQISVEIWPSQELLRLYELREEYPVINIADRVEKVRRTKITEPQIVLDPIESQAVFNSRADRQIPWLRNNLQLIHDQQFEKFVKSPGFGQVRMNPRWLSIPIKESRNISSVSPLLGHLSTYVDFVHPATLGEGTGKSLQFIGFRPHRVTEPPRTIKDPTDPGIEYSLEKLELIGLLLHETPVVYESENLPNMEAVLADQMPIRPLDAFETESLEKLRAGETFVLSNDHQQLRMVGAVRSITQCTDCHGSNPGELLGAFSYIFNRETSVD
jgi:hypothetical protein